MNTQVLPVSVEKLEFDIPCAIEGVTTPPNS